MPGTKNSGWGILLILVSGLLLSSHDALSKTLTQFYPVLMLVWVRYVVQTVLLAAIYGPRLGRELLRTRRPLIQLARGASLVGVSLLFFTALHYIPLGEATAVIFLAPLVVIVLSATLLKERISRDIWLSAGACLLGVLMIVRPGGALFTPAILLALAAALCFGVYQLLTRAVSYSDHPATSNFLASAIGAVLLAPLLPWFWQVPRLQDALLIGGLGVLATMGHMFMTHAYRFASAATLAPFNYGQIVFAAALGLVYFHHTPDLGALFGMLVIIVSGVALAWSSQR